MSKEQQKRYRQLNIMDSFALGKKVKTYTETSSMEQNLRNLVAAAAEKRLESTKTQNEVKKPGFDSTDKAEARAGTSTLPSEKMEIPDSEESCLERLFESSPELFPDSPIVEQCSSQESDQNIVIDSESCPSDSGTLFVEEYDTEVDSEVDDDDDVVSLTFLNRTPDCSIPLPKLEPLENHSIMFSPHIRPGDAPRPYPSSYRDKWDSDHVRMPCSPENRFPVEDMYGEKQIRSRWDLICQSLRRRIYTSEDLEEAIMVYNSQYKGKWNFIGLHTFFNTCLSNSERAHFFDNVLPRMIDTALNLPNICTRPIPLLKKDKDHYITMSQKQIGCLLLNAFFCTFPRRNYISRNTKNRWNSEYSSYPDINFNRLFTGCMQAKQRLSSNLGKLKCLINYFRRIVSNEPSGTVTFHRQFLKELPRWEGSTRGIRTSVVKCDGLIETEGHGLLQVDFANKFVGGGVLGTGCVQEEIRFVICPELVVSRLFVECLGPKEALIITGVEQYNKYSGYSDTFKWIGSFEDQTSRDAWGRRCTEIVAINATHFNVLTEQYKTYYVERELNKAFCGFYKDGLPPNLSAIATGNWGCGAFKGDPNLKFLIQLMAASQAGRDLLYFTFGNKVLKKDLKRIYDLLTEKNLSVGDLWRIVISYCNTVKVYKKEICPKMYDFLCSLFSNDDTDIEDSNQMTPDITDSDRNAIQRLIEDVNDENTETEEDNSQLNNLS